MAETDRVTGQTGSNYRNQAISLKTPAGGILSVIAIFQQWQGSTARTQLARAQQRDTTVSAAANATSGESWISNSRRAPEQR